MGQVSHSVQLFTSDNSLDLEYMINDLLQNLDKLDIKYTVDFKYDIAVINDSVGTIKSKLYSCLVMITEVKCVEVKL